RRIGDRRGGDLRRDGAEVERGLYSLWRGHAYRPGRGLAAAAEAHPQRADQADADARLWRRLRLRPRRARGFFRAGLFPRTARTAEILRSARARLRARDQEAAGILGEAATGEIIRQNRAGEKSASGTSPGIQTINDAVADLLNRTRIVMVSTVAKQERGRPAVAERAPPSTGVQTTKVTADEAGLRGDRSGEARFPGLPFPHTQRIIRRGELRVNGKRAQPKQRLEAGQAVRIPPLRLDQPRPSGRDANARDQTRAFLK